MDCEEIDRDRFAGWFPRHHRRGLRRHACNDREGRDDECDHNEFDHEVG